MPDPSVFPRRRPGARNALATAFVIALGLATAAIVLASLGRAPGAPQAPNVARAKAAIRYAARDADSIVFRNVEARPGGAVCGEFNGRNGFGALAGFRRFVWRADDTLSVEDGKDPFEHAWNHTCLGIEY